MLLVSVIPKGWESPLHVRQSQASWSETLAVPVHAAMMVGDGKKALAS